MAMVGQMEAMPSQPSTRGSLRSTIRWEYHACTPIPRPCNMLSGVTPQAGAKVVGWRVTASYLSFPLGSLLPTAAPRSQVRLSLRRAGPGEEGAQAAVHQPTTHQRWGHLNIQFSYIKIHHNLFNKYNPLEGLNTKL